MALIEEFDRPLVNFGETSLTTEKRIEQRDIGLSGVAVSPDRMRALRPEAIKELANSMRKQGLLHPILLRPTPGVGNGYFLIAGAHRYHAAKKLGWKHIAARIFHGWSDDEANLAEIDENLIRADLTSTERAQFTAARKNFYVAAHPETKKGGDFSSAQAKELSPKSGHRTTAFIDKMSETTGRSRSSIAKDVARAEALADDLGRIFGTSLDKGVELDALAAMTPEQRAPLIARAASGEKVSAQPLRQETSRGPDGVRKRIRDALQNLQGQPNAAEVAGYFEGSDDAIIVTERLGPAVTWLVDFALQFTLTHHPENFTDIFRSVFDQASSETKRDIRNIVIDDSEVI